MLKVIKKWLFDDFPIPCRAKLLRESSYKNSEDGFFVARRNLIIDFDGCIDDSFKNIDFSGVRSRSSEIAMHLRWYYFDQISKGCLTSFKELSISDESESVFFYGGKTTGHLYISPVSLEHSHWEIGVIFYHSVIRSI